MIHFLQAAPVEAGKEVIEAAKNGQIDQLIKEAITMGMEAGKSLLLAAVVAVAGHYAIKFINKLVARMLERRNVEPTVQSFLRSFVNITLLVLLIIMVGKSVVAVALVNFLRYPLHSSLTIGASLAQIGEFSYILAAQGISLKMVGSEMMSLIVAASILSIALNPCMFAAVSPFGKFLQRHFLWARKAALRENQLQTQPSDKPEPLGQIVVECNDQTSHRLAVELSRSGFPVVCIATDQSEAEQLRTDRLSAVVGKVTDRLTLSEANVDAAKAVVLSGLHFVDGSDAIGKIRVLNPGVHIIIRAANEVDRKFFAEQTTANLVLMDEQMIAEYMTASVREQCASRIIVAQ
jgi:CPA2 family monovalent cation:H+ antiporter-2